MRTKFRSAEDEERYIEGRLTVDESRRAIAWDKKYADLQAALEADLIAGFDIKPIDLALDEIIFSFSAKPQLEQLALQAAIVVPDREGLSGD